MFPLSMLGKNFSRWQFEIFFFIFPQKKALTFHANYLLRNCQSLFSGIIREVSSVLSSAEFAPRVVYNKVPSKIIADDILIFSRKISLDVSCELFAKQMIHMKCCTLFSLKI